MGITPCIPFNKGGIKIKESPIFVKTYDFTKWLLEHTIKFPKSQRFVMAKRIEDAILNFYDLLLLAVKETCIRFVKRLSRMLQFYKLGLIRYKNLNVSVQSWLGHARHADTYGLRKDMFQKIPFKQQAIRKVDAPDKAGIKTYAFRCR